MPRAMTKADYENLGAARGREGSEVSPFSRASKSWQARAYWAAYDEEAAKKAQTAPSAAIAAAVIHEAAPILQGAWDGLGQSLRSGLNIQNMPRIRLTQRIERKHPRLGLIVSTIGPLYPPRIKGRSRRPGGWTATPF